MQIFAWCQSVRTGHRFSLPLERLDQLGDAVIEIPGRRHTTPLPPKPRRPKGVGPSPRRRRSQ